MGTRTLTTGLACFFLLTGSLASPGCDGQGSKVTAPGDDPDTAGQTGSTQARLLYNGAVRIPLSAKSGAAGVAAFIDVSAPIFPKVLTLYQAEGDKYPATPVARQALIQDALMTYDFLLTQCSALAYPVTLGSDTTVTEAKLILNYNEVARCSYEHFTAKPYLIPQLVDDEDICQLKMGSEWRMITAADLTGWGTEVFTRLNDTLSSAASSQEGLWGSFYFSLVVFVRDAQGALAAANLAPEATVRMAALPASNRTYHLEMLEVAPGQSKTVVLRCLRQPGS